MQEVRELIGTRADLAEHLTGMRDNLQAEAKRLGKPADRERMHGRAEGVELVLRELAVWTQTDGDPVEAHHDERDRFPGPAYGAGEPA